MDFPNIKQAEGSKTCGPVCVQAIMRYFGDEIGLDEILDFLDVDDKSTTHLPQLARFLNNENYKTEIFSSSPYNFTWEWKDLGKDELIEKYKSWVTHNFEDEWLRDHLFLLFYLQEGGDIRFGNLTKEVIEGYLKNEYLVLTCLEESWLWGKRKLSGKTQYDDIRGHARGHFVVLFDDKNDKFMISDPYTTGIEDKEGIYMVDKDTIITATLTWGAQILAVKKNS